MSDPITITANPRRPKAGFDDISQLGLKAHALAAEHETTVGPRLSAGLLDALAADLTKLGVAVPGAKQVRAEVRTSTIAHADAARKGIKLFRAVRNNARKRVAAPEVKSGYGVGRKVHEEVPDEVSAALKSVIDRATANPEEAAALGIVPKDLAAMAEAHAAITGAGAAQSQKRAAAPLTTRERNQTANRILAAVAAINSAGALEFATDAVKRAQFEALKPSTPKRKPAKKDTTMPVTNPDAGPATIRDTKTPPVEPTPPEK